jgi:long-subunit fatty acid transport protein
VPIGAGPRALGMGGAFTAIADDATANTWNPAGMAQLERPEASASHGWYRQDLELSDGASDHESDLDLDHVSLVLPFYRGRFQQTVGIAWQRQFDFTRGFDIEQRETSGGAGTTLEVDNDITTEQEGSFSSLSASYAIEVYPGLAFGVTGHAWGDRWTLDSSYDRSTRLRGTTTIRLDFPPISNADNIAIDKSQHTEVEEGYSSAIGLWWQSTPMLTFGAVVRPEYHLRLHRRTETHEVHDNPDSDTTTITNTRAEYTYPTSATVAAAWRYVDTQTVALDVTWTHWSAYHTTQDGAVRSPIHPFIDPSDFDDGWSVRLGYEYLIILQRAVVVARLGALYEGLPAAKAVADVDQAEQTSATRDDYYGGTVGMSVCRRQQIYDLGAQYRFGNDVGAGQIAAPDKTADIRAVTVRFGFAWLF